MMMRQFFIFLVVVCFFSCKNEQKTPNLSKEQTVLPMQEDFAKRYPNVHDVIWDTLDLGFAASFSDDDFEYTTHYDAKGLFQYTATFIEQTDLPKEVQQVLNKKYKNAAAAVIMRVENGKSKTYQIELETGTDYINLEFDDSGKLLKEEKHPLSNEEMQREEEEGVDENEK
jgi:hypothetical protein